MACKMKHFVLTICISALAAAGSTFLLNAYAQNVANKQKVSAPLAISGQKRPELDLEKLRDKRASIEANTDIDPAVKTQVIKHLDRAIGFNETAEKLYKETDALSNLLKSAPDRIEKIKSELLKQAPPAESIVQLNKDMETAKMEQLLQEEEAELMSLQTAKSNFDDQLDNLKTLPERLPKEIENLNQRLTEVQKELDTPSTSAENPSLADARITALQSEKAVINLQIRLYNQQLAGHMMVQSLISAERDWTDLKIVNVQNRLKFIQQTLQLRRQEEAEEEIKEVEKAREKAPDILPVIQEQYDINIKLGEELERLARKEAPLVEKLEKLKVQLKELRAEFEIAKERVTNVVLTEAIGLSLREQRRLLPSESMYRLESADRQLEMSELQEAQIELDRKRREFSDIDPLLRKLVSSASYLPQEKIDRLTSDLRGLLNKRRVLMEKLKDSYTRIFKLLRDMEYTEQQLVTVADNFADFLDRHLLWMRSSKPLHPEDLAKVQVAVSWYFNLHYWDRMFEDVRTAFRSNVTVWILGLLLAVFIFSGRRWARRQLKQIAAQVDHQERDSFALTLGALCLTFYLAVGWPFLLGLLAAQLRSIQTAHVFTVGIADGLWNAAVMFLFFEFLRFSLKKGGLIQTHFRWREAARSTLYRHMKWAVPLAIVTGAVVAMMEGTKELEFSDSLAKLALIAQGVGGALWVAIVMRFSGGVVSGWIKEHSKFWLVRMRYVWYPLAIGLPVFLIILVSVGFYYSAVEIRNLIRETILLAVVLVYFHELVMRWLTLTRRNITREEAQREADREIQEISGNNTMAASLITSDTGKPGETAEPDVELSQISAQTLTLLRTTLLIVALIGLWTIWDDVLPAFGILQDIQLWSYTSTVDGVAKTFPITLAHLALAIVVTAATVVAAKNLPGLLEIILLNRLPMDAGARYAFTRICSYAIVTLGIVVAFTTIGIKWSSLQWLIAALGVGLGFGLQEIVANFVSGLIVLFERPCRVGDTVTIGETTGTISRIRIRATTIVDWDRKELIVPNKEFITGRLINWSLTDDIIRFKIPVGIAYGSDTVLAEKLLLKAARSNPLVLKKPEPNVVFLSFGDNSLNFEVRVFIKGIDEWVRLMHSMNMSIDREFREAGITIAFPQRDVHLDADGPLEIRVVSGDSKLKSSDAVEKPESNLDYPE